MGRRDVDERDPSAPPIVDPNFLSFLSTFDERRAASRDASLGE